MHQPLKKADMILVLGNRDLRIAEYAAQLYLDGWASLLVCSGSGSIHNDKPGREQFVGTTEAEVFANVAIKMGVPKESIVIENESQNTGENIKFAIQKLKDQGIEPKRIIIVQKPYMERRAYAAGKIWLPKTDLIVASPQISFERYPNDSMSMDQVMDSLVGDIQRIKDYPRKGFQIEQEIPKDVWGAYEYLISLGYTKKLI